MGTRQARFFYGPLFGFLMGLIFSKASAKHSSASWYVSEKPPHYSEEEYSSQWQPLKDPYYTITTYFPSAFSSVSGFGEETAAASNIHVRRRRPDGYKTKSKHRKTNNRPKRRRTTTTTTTEAYYYDDYYSEEYDVYSEEVKPFVKRRRTTTTPAYEDYEDYSVESTTKPAKRRKKPTFSSASLELDDVESTTTKRFQAQIETSTTETTTEETGNVTTMSTTTTTFAGYNGTNRHDNVTFTYGPPTGNNANFGPVYSNYGPPSLSRLDYAPFINWYNHFKSKNDVVKRVQDIVGDEDFVGFADIQQ